MRLFAVLRRVFLLFLVYSVVQCNGWASPHFPGGDSLSVKLGQMIMVGFRGLEATSLPILDDIALRNIGGVVLFDYDVPAKSPVRNIRSAEQVAGLTDALQKKAAIPLFIAIDQEGGKITRLKEKNGFPATVSQAVLGKRGDEEAVTRQANRTASLLNSLGINVNFAPVVDLNVNPESPAIGKLERSFSASAATVANMAWRVIEAHRAHKVLTAIKHFPGHGSASADSHLGITDVTNTWMPIELEPYRTLISLGRCDMVMTAHIYNAKLDPAVPATLSKAVLGGILRDSLKFDGVVFSDDLQMKAVADHYGLETAVRLAVEAGVDVLLFANNSVYDPDITTKALAVLKKLVADGTVSMQRIDQSFRRIMKMKKLLR